MRRLEEYARFTGLQAFRKSTVAARPMRVEKITGRSPRLRNRLANLFVRIGSAGNIGGNGGMGISVEVDDTGEIARIAHVHGIGDGGDGRTGSVCAGLQIPVKNIVAVVGGDETLHGKPHLLGKQSGGNIAEIAARHANNHILRFSDTFQLRVRIEVIEGLGKKAGHIDGVGGGEGKVSVKLFIHESGFHQCLTVVECPVHFNRRDVPSQRGKLFFLYFTYFPLRIKHVHANPFHAEEAVGYGTSRIAGGSHQHIDLPMPLLPDEITQQARHEPCAYIFEGERRSVKEFQRINILRHPYQRDVEIQCIAYDLAQNIRRNIFTEEGFRHTKRCFLKRKRIDRIVKLLRKSFDGCGHKQPFVCGKPFHHSFLQRNRRRFFIGTVIVHSSFLFYDKKSSAKACPDNAPERKRNTFTTIRLPYYPNSSASESTDGTAQRKGYSFFQSAHVLCQ